MKILTTLALSALIGISTLHASEMGGGEDPNHQQQRVPGQLPADFDAETYLRLNPDLDAYANSQRLNRAQRVVFAERHYVEQGHAEGRRYR